MTQEECCICLENMESKTPLITLSCKHSMHTRCFLNHLSKKPEQVDCPLCRKNVLVIEVPRDHIITINDHHIRETNRSVTIAMGLCVCVTVSMWLLYATSECLTSGR